MNIHKTPSGDLLEIALEGALDNQSSVHFRDEVDAATRNGWHRIVVDLQGVSYLSSAGIGALVAAKRQLDQLNGLFGIFNLVPQVADVLRQVRLHDLLVCDPKLAREARSAGSMTMALSASTRMASGEGVDMEIYPLDDSHPLTCEVIGRPDRLLGPTFSSHEITCGYESLGLGVGALGTQPIASKNHVGELVFIGGSAAQSPRKSGGLPDYSVAEEDFRPTAQLIYGICCRGTLPTLIRFEASPGVAHISLSTVVGQAMKQIDADVAAIAILADSAGLVGAQLRQIPDAAASESHDHYQVPQVRNWITFGSDRLHLQSLALIVGVAVVGKLSPESPLSAFVRKMRPDAELYGHFHAAVFPYQPLKKRTLKLGPAITELFKSETIRDVLHLLHDDRPITGAGESELLSGACWIGAIDKIENAGD